MDDAILNEAKPNATVRVSSKNMCGSIAASQSTPWDLFKRASVPQANKARYLPLAEIGVGHTPVDHPEIACGIDCDRVHPTLGDGLQGNEAVIVEIPDPAASGDPDSPARILSEAKWHPLNSDSCQLLVAPSDHTISLGEPNGSILGRNNRLDDVTR
jgi:hypothetical protein